MEDMELSIRRGWRTALDETRGVAGIARRRRRAPIADGDVDVDDNDGGGEEGGYYGSGVKCLHAHVAHYLAQVAEWEEEGCRDCTISSASAWSRMMECPRDDLNIVGKWTMEAVMKTLRPSCDDADN
jgi:hypothetical protein